MNCPFAFEQPSGRPHRWMVVGISRKLLVLQNPAYRPTHCFYSTLRQEQIAIELE
jgi:hypothetical protein